MAYMGFEKNEKRKRLVLHYVWKYLFLTGGWIYWQILYLIRYRSVIVTGIRENTEIYPASHLHVLPRINHNQSVLAKLLNSLVHFLHLDQLYLLFLTAFHNPDIIHVHFGNSGWENLFLRKLLRKKYIVSFYGYDYSYLIKQESIWKERYKILFQKADAFIAEGPYARKTLISLGCPKEKVFENHLGVDLSQIDFFERKFPARSEPIRLLQIASLIEKKGHLFSVQAFSKALKQVPNLSLTFVGSGELHQILEKIVFDLGIKEHIIFIPTIPYKEVLDIARKHHIFIHPSIHASDGNCEGGAPVILLDMQASGMPIISTKHCDIPSYVLDGISGFLVEEKNIEALTEKIIYLANHGEIWPEMGRKGRDHVQKEFNAIMQARRLELIYDKVINTK